ncbi:MAG: aspartate dehydrogenase, partial [Methanosarcinales archaeon]|nr:aspartate dehydrogenase [Methanosarcinales archaeon]
KAIDDGTVDADLVAICDRHPETLQKAVDMFTSSPHPMSLDNMVGEVDLIVECASPSAATSIILKTLSSGTDVMVMSVGVLLNKDFYEECVGLASKNNCRIYIPSGAVAGVDGLKSASVGRIDSVTLTTTKPPGGLKGAPYIESNNIDLDAITEKTVVFDGVALDAIKGFPANVNVSATLSLAGIGAENTHVVIVADPAATRNVHRIQVEGEFGSYSVKVNNVPSPTNPKTSYLAALSAIATLKSIIDPVQIGT